MEEAIKYLEQQWEELYDKIKNKEWRNGYVQAVKVLREKVREDEQKALREPDKCPKCGTYLSIRNKKRGKGVEPVCPECD